MGMWTTDVSTRRALVGISGLAGMLADGPGHDGEGKVGGSGVCTPCRARVGTGAGGGPLQSGGPTLVGEVDR